MDLTIFDGAQHKGSGIALAADASRPERFASQELQRYLKMVTGGDFPISSSIADAGFVIGSAARPLVDRLPDLSEDGYTMKRVGNQIALVGGSPRATLYAVYHFLERYADFRWLEPGDDHVPAIDKLEVGDIGDLEEPVYKMRSIVNFPFTVDQMLKEVDWMAKTRLNWTHPAPNHPHTWEEVNAKETLMPDVTKRGLHNLWGGHSFQTWIPNDVYLETHPDFFALINGQRGEQQNFRGSLCLSNPGVAKEVAKNMLAFQEKNPDIEVVDIWINDTQDWCECDACKEMEGEYDYVDYPDVFCTDDRPLKSRSYFTFVNEVAKLIRAAGSSLQISPLAYFLTYEPPRELKLEPNVRIGFTNFARTWEIPLMSDTRRCNVGTDAAIRRWRDVTENLFIYEYYACPAMFNSFTATLTNVAQMAEELRYYPTIGIRLMSSESGADEYWRPLVMYAYARLTWNPEESHEAIIEDFCRHAYGDVAEPMIDFWRYQETRTPFLTRKEENMVTLERIKKMTSDEKVLARINRLEMFLSQPDNNIVWPSP